MNGRKNSDTQSAFGYIVSALTCFGSGSEGVCVGVRRGGFEWLREGS